ncbi:MAG: 1-acyl-sn-glycerol-3-phosphate acyltransferase [Bacteroidales bacterium]|jgi:1-acyl-sn-glycerol-3-phosphate acyltransferase
MMKYIYKLILKIMGWKVMDTPVPEPKCIILGAPHTSGWDFVISFLFYHSLGASAYIMVKKAFFWGPFGPIMRSMGGIPVDKNKGATLTRQIIEEFNSRERLHLAIAPEGTRKNTEKWKTGFHTIARAANIPVYLGYFDWGKKEVGRGERFEITDDVQGDLKRIRQWYKDKGVQGKFPENFNLGKDLE